MEIIDKTLEKEAVRLAVEFLQKDGSVILMPTETVYGLFCRWDDELGKKKILQIKSRDPEKPFQMIAPNSQFLEQYNIQITRQIQCVINKFYPGPLTVIANTNNSENNKETIGFRIPAFPFLISIMNKANCCLAATSANLSGHPPIQTIEDAMENLETYPDLIIDAGKIDGQASTVLDMTTDTIKILRKGPVTENEIKESLCLLD